MKKRIQAIICTLAMCAAISVPAMADNNEINVVVNDCHVFFGDQAPICENDRTLVPLRGVFNALGCHVSWYGDENRVVIDTKDNKKRIALNIDDNVMRVYTFKTVIEMERNDVELDVAPKMINDRTMVSLRAISDAINATVDWDEATQTVSINSIGDLDKDTLPHLYIKADKTECKVGETVTISMYADRMVQKDEYSLSSMAGAIDYNKGIFDYSGIEYFPQNGNKNMINAENAGYLDEYLKYAQVSGGVEITSDDEIELSRITLTAQSAGEANISILNLFDTRLGYANQLNKTSEDYKSSKTYQSADELVIDSTPISITVTE